MTTGSAKTLTRVTQVALVVNAVLHSVASVGMAAGLDPHAAQEPHMARRAAAAGFAAAVMFLVVSKRLRRDPVLIALAIAFVFCNLTATIIDFLSGRQLSALAPLAPEATFLAIYTLFAVRVARG